MSARGRGSTSNSLPSAGVLPADRDTPATSRTVLLHNELGLVENLRVHGPPAKAPRTELFSPDYQVSMPYRGLCVWHVGRDDVMADPNRVKFITGGEAYRVSRPIDGGHGELLVTARPSLFAELLGTPERSLARHDVFRRRSRPSDPALQRLGVERLLQSPTVDVSELAGEEWVLMFLRRALQVSPLAEPTPATTRIVSRAKEYLSSHLSAPIRLGDVAGAAAVSPAYLTSLFSRVEGMSVHRYLVRLRLARALIELPHAADLTRLACDLGFSHHSHFSSCFHRAFGCTPSQFRAVTQRDGDRVRARQPPSH